VITINVNQYKFFKKTSVVYTAETGKYIRMQTVIYAVKCWTIKLGENVIVLSKSNNRACAMENMKYTEI